MTELESSSPRQDAKELAANLVRFTDSPRSLKICLLLAIFVNRLILALNAPFFPTHAKEVHNLTNSEIGWTFSVFSIANMTLSPIVGFTLRNVGMKKTLVAGLVTEVVGLLAFGSLAFYESDEIYLLVAILTRILLGIGAASTLAPSFAIMANAFPGEVDVMMSLGQAVSGLGYTCGPIFGGVFYLIGGFTLPFIAAAIVTLIAILMALCVIKQDQTLTIEDLTFAQKIAYLNRWQIIFPALCAMCASAAIGGLEVSIGNHLKDDFRLDLGSILEVLSFLAFSYVIAAAVLGPLLAKGILRKDSVMMMGMVGIALAMIFVGPEFPFDTQSALPIFFGGPMIGIGGSMSIVPVVSEQVDQAMKHHSKAREDLNNILSGIFASSLATGALLGFNTVGMVSDGYDFRTAYDILGILASIVGFSYFMFRVVWRCKERQASSDGLDQPLIQERSPSQTGGTKRRREPDLCV